jgi:hypothetical protein
MADLFETLSESYKRKLAGPEFLSKLRALAAAHPAQTGRIIGGVAFTAGQYLSNRATKGGKSQQQRAYGNAERRVLDAKREREREGRKPSMVEETAEIMATPLRQLGDAAARRPLRYALVAAPFGASLGAAVAKKLIR